MEVKVQCGCGLKYAFDVEPVDGRMPATIFCPKCGGDGTASANEMIAAQLGQPSAAPAAEKAKLRVSAVQGAPAAQPSLVPVPPAPQAGKLRVSAAHAPAAAAAAPAQGPAPTAGVYGFCHRHPRSTAAARCVVCQKSICPMCMSQFGYLCSVGCRYQAEQMKIDVPVYEGQQSVVQANWWRKAGLYSGLAGLVIAALIGVWIWYIWAGSKPRVMYTLNFTKGNEVLHAQFLSNNQMLLVRPKQIALHDIKKKSDVWTADLDAPSALTADNAAANAAAADIDESDGYYDRYDRPQVHVTRDAIWVCAQRKLMAFDRKSGARQHDIVLGGSPERLTANASWLSVISVNKKGNKTITQVDVTTGETVKQNVVVTPVERQFVTEEMPSGASPTAAYLLDRELASADEKERAMKKVFSEFIPAGINAVEMQVQLTKVNLVSVEVMKKPGPSSLNGNTSIATGAGVVAEEIFNELKRNRGGGYKTVDESTYKVTVRRLPADAGKPWTGEVVGPPALFPQKTVDVLVGGKTLIIFDKQNTKLGETKLNYTIAEYYDSGTAGPALELDNSLYFYDQGVLTAFELPGCNIKWRLTSVGISDVISDGRGNLYVNSTTASPEDIQYSEQIKIGDRTEEVILKVDAASGKTLWKSERVINPRVSGKFLYAMSEPAGGVGLLVGLGNAVGNPTGGGGSIYRLYRISPSNGGRVWEYERKYAPDQIDFSGNRILMLDDGQLEVLKYISF